MIVFGLQNRNTVTISVEEVPQNQAEAGTAKEPLSFTPVNPGLCAPPNLQFIYHSAVFPRIT